MEDLFTTKKITCFVLVFLFSHTFSQDIVEQAFAYNPVNSTPNTHFNTLNIGLQSVKISFEDESGKVHSFQDALYFSEPQTFKNLPSFQADETTFFLELKDESNNGYIYRYNTETTFFDKELLFENEPYWTKTIFGKPKNGNPVLYHIDTETNFIYQSYLKDGKWKIHRTFPLTDAQLEELLAEQSLKSSIKNPNTFDVDMDIQDSYFQLLELNGELENNPKYYKEGAIKYPNNAENGPFYIPECWKTQKTTESDVVEIDNMPPVKTQDTMGECRAFSLAAVIQKFICENSKNPDGSKRNIDCANPPPDKAISYFGMMTYTNSIQSNVKSLQSNMDWGPSTFSVISKITDAGDGFILESCKPFDEMASKFSFYNDNGDKKAEEFLNYTKLLYQQRAKPTIEGVENCNVCLENLSIMTGFEKNQINLQKGLTKKTYNEFLFTLLFADCKFRDVSRGFRQIHYPAKDEAISNEELKSKIVQGIRKGNPILYPNLCLTTPVDCNEIHSIVISGYKKVCCNNKCEDAFKVHNSWGQEWQDRNNDGWVSADNLLDKTARDGSKENKIFRASVIWLE